MGVVLGSDLSRPVELAGRQRRRGEKEGATSHPANGKGAAKENKLCHPYLVKYLAGLSFLKE